MPQTGARWPCARLAIASTAPLGDDQHGPGLDQQAGPPPGLRILPSQTSLSTGRTHGAVHRTFLRVVLVRPHRGRAAWGSRRCLDNGSSTLLVRRRWPRPFQRAQRLTTVLPPRPPAPFIEPLVVGMPPRTAPGCSA